MLMMLILQVLLYKWSSGSPGLHDSENSSEVSLRVSVWPAGWLTLSSVWLQYQHHEVGPGEHDGQDGAVRQQPGEPRHWEDWGLFLWEEEDWGSVVRATTQVSDLLSQPEIFKCTAYCIAYNYNAPWCIDWFNPGNFVSDQFALSSFPARLWLQILSVRRPFTLGTFKWSKKIKR